MEVNDENKNIFLNDEETFNDECQEFLDYVNSFNQQEGVASLYVKREGNDISYGSQDIKAGLVKKEFKKIHMADTTGLEKIYELLKNNFSGFSAAYLYTFIGTEAPILVDLGLDIFVWFGSYDEYDRKWFDKIKHEQFAETKGNKVIK